jgi:uncharacterized protein YjbJ (UPF0337 family)
VRKDGAPAYATRLRQGYGGLRAAGFGGQVRKIKGRKTKGVLTRGRVHTVFFCCTRGENQMKASTKNEVAGSVHEVKGKVKQTIGRVANDPGLEGEGIGEKIGGKIQKTIGRVQKVVEKP